jgi:hypothetical protein
MTGNQADLETGDALDPISRFRITVLEKVSNASRLHDIKSALVVGAMVAAQALPSPWHIIAIAVGGVILGNLAHSFAESRGILVAGMKPPRARRVATAVIVAIGLLLFSSLILSRHLGLAWAPFPLGVAAAAVALAGSRLWLRVYRAEMRR